MKKSLVIIFLIFCNTYTFSQKIENVIFDAIDDKIIINYDITDCPLHENYDISVKFVDANGKTIYPKSISGDLLSVTCGQRKTIIWNVLNDQDELSGKLSAFVDITKRHKTKIEGGPSNAFLSLLVPGLGDKKVNINNEHTYVKPYLITLAAYGCVGYGLICKFQSKKFYENYHKATTQSDIDNYYKKANDNNHNFITYTSIGATIWICDIIFVAIKGSKNKKNQLMYSSISSNRNFFLTTNDRGVQFNYVINF